MTNLFLHVFQRVGRVDGEADENDVGIGVRQGSQTAIPSAPVPAQAHVCVIPTRSLLGRRYPKEPAPLSCRPPRHRQPGLSTRPRAIRAYMHSTHVVLKDGRDVDLELVSTQRRSDIATAMGLECDN